MLLGFRWDLNQCSFIAPQNPKTPSALLRYFVKKLIISHHSKRNAEIGGKCRFSARSHLRYVEMLGQVGQSLIELLHFLLMTHLELLFDLLAHTLHLDLLEAALRRS